MLDQLTPEGCRFVEEMQLRFGLADDAILVLLRAVLVGDGRCARFEHPALGGQGLWRADGKVEIATGDHLGLKAQIAGLCAEIARRLAEPGPLVEPTSPWLEEAASNRASDQQWNHEPPGA
jgi:hypothetical protein